MREKKEYTIITFDTTTEAIAMENECRSRGIPGRLIPLPKEISAGCGLSWRMDSASYEEYSSAIRELGLKSGQTVTLML